MPVRFLWSLSIPVALALGYWLLSSGQSPLKTPAAFAALQTEPRETLRMKSVTETTPPVQESSLDTVGLWRQFERHRYGPDSKNVLYLYRPPTGFNRLALLVHGGNYLSGTAKDGSMEALARFFMKRGYAVASIEYRTLTTERWPVPVLDVAQGIHTTRELLKKDDIQDVTYAGYSAGAVTGALLLYSREFPDVSGIHRFIGLSGLYDKDAIGAEPVAAIRQHSLEHLSILEVVDQIDAPKQAVPALLIEGSQDFFADVHAGSPQSHAARFSVRLQQHGVDASVFWADKPGFNGHEGPISLVAIQDGALVQAMERFLRKPHPS